MTVALRPLSLGELLDQTFQIYRQHFLVFVGIVALPGLVPLGLNVALNQLRSGIGVAAGIAVTCAILLLQLVIMAISQAGTITAVSEVYLGRPISIGGAFAAARGRIIELWIISLLVGLFTGLGFLFLIVPGILLALRWSVAVPVVVIEGLPPRAAMARSSALTEGHRGRAFMIYVVYIVIALIIGAIWQVPIGFFVAMNARSITAASSWVLVVTQVSAFVTQCLVGPLMTIALSLFYYDERVRKEAFDLDHMMSRIDEAPGGPSPVTA